MPKPLIDCMFCGASEVESSGEDVFPLWLQKKLRYFAERHHPSVLPTYVNYTYDNHAVFQSAVRARDFGTSAVEEDILGARPAAYKLPDVCLTCNGGWMGRLEDAATRLIPGFIEGKSKVLAPFDQFILSTWMIKTCLTYDASREPRCIAEEIGSRRFFQLGYPLPLSMVVVAHDEGHVMEGGLAHGRMRVDGQSSASPNSEAVHVAFQFDRLILRRSSISAMTSPRQGPVSASLTTRRTSNAFGPHKARSCGRRIPPGTRLRKRQVRQNQRCQNRHNGRLMGTRVRYSRCPIAVKGCVCERGGVGYNSCMGRMRLGLVVGFAAGYYLGAKAGRERYDQIQRWLRDFRGSAPYEKAQAAVELGIERVKQQAEPLVGSDTGSPNGPRG